ncbi:LysR family transcriptional regulator [Acinetobacter marinus]|nr:LysR family transcriptional regulator [Acinetobacter marinus]
METIERLRTFCLVADKQSFAQAANQLGLPRSTVTYTIQALEKEYEVLLFYRTTRKVTLTHEGELFYDEAMRLISQLKELNRFKAQIRHQQGKISIGLPKRMATQILIPHLHEFYEKYPDVKVLINGSDDFSNLLEDQLDCVVRVGAVQDDYLIRRPVTEVSFSTLVSPSYIEKLGAPTDLNALEAHFAVDYHVAKNYAEFSVLDFHDQKVKIPYRLLVENTEAYIHAGLAGHGMIQIPYFDAKSHIDNGALVPIFTEIPALKLPINILLADRKYRPKYLQDFVEWLQPLLIKNLC